MYFSVLKILQNSQENTCVRVSFLIKLHMQSKHMWLGYLEGSKSKIKRIDMHHSSELGP